MGVCRDFGLTGDEAWLLWKREFCAALPAVPIMLTAFIVQGAAFWIGPASMSLGKPSIPMQANLLRVIVLVIGSFWLVRPFGYVYQAWTFFGMVVVSTAWALARIAHQLHRERSVQRTAEVAPEAT